MTNSVPISHWNNENTIASHWKSAIVRSHSRSRRANMRKDRVLRQVELPFGKVHLQRGATDLQLPRRLDMQIAARLRGSHQRRADQ